MDLQDIGVAPEEVAKLRALYGVDDGGAGDVPVTPDNWPAVQVFLAQDGRWRRKPNGALEGLDMAQVKSTTHMMGMKRKARPKVFWKLLKMEQAALEEMAR